MSSQVVKASARYSALAEKWDIVLYLLDFHEIKESPMKIQKPVVERRVSIQEAQSESAKARSWKDLHGWRRMPCPEAFFKYFNKWWALDKCALHGFDTNWLSLLTVKVISDLKIVKYNKRPIKHLYSDMDREVSHLPAEV